MRRHLHRGGPARAIPVDVWIVAGLVVVATLIRFVTISTQSLWTDETLTAFETTLPFGSMIHTVAHVETTPPLYFVLVWSWAKLFGTSEAALRSLSALAGIVLVPIAYLSARELFSRRSGVIAAAFVTFNPFMIWYSQEARAYMLLAALTGASLLFFLRARANPRSLNLVGWVVCSALAMMTHFFAGFVIAPEAVWLLYGGRTRAVSIAIAAIAVAQLAMLPFALIDTGHGVSWIARTPRGFRVGQTALEFGVNTMFRSASTAQGLTGAAVLLVAVALLIARGGDRRTRSGAIVVGSIVAFAFLAPLLLGFVGQDYFLGRNLIGIWLPLAIVFAGASVVPRARLAGGALAVALLAMFIGAQITIQGNANYQRPQWRRLAHAIGPTRYERAFMVASGTASDPLKWYLPGVSWVQPTDRVALIREIDVVGTHKREDLIEDDASLPEVAHAHDRRDVGIAQPLAVAPRGTRLDRRFHVRGWIVARFVLRNPLRIDAAGVARLAPRFFRQAPASLLVFLQRPTR